ncbi:MULTISPECIES: hypothetical protein [unclassified Sinorhizobium]|uniref:hypothetical protein n=1 Tax=unclassified Sinorhizobium TaxID=2613772 RepID=UPI0035231966
MTAQSPERIILGGYPHALYETPLYRLLKSFRIEPIDYVETLSTSCWRGYCGTWEIMDDRLYLVHLNLRDRYDSERKSDEWPIPEVLKARILRAAASSNFPIFAHWFNGRLRIAIGRGLVYSHHGWSSWFERERVIQFRGGKVIRDREVDTRRILEWFLRRNPEVSDILSGETDQVDVAPLVWFDETDADPHADTWWPPDYTASSNSLPIISPLRPGDS